MGKYLELLFIFESEALCQVIFEKLASETIEPAQIRQATRRRPLLAGGRAVENPMWAGAGCAA
jgi:hypothetical protein